MSQHDLDIANGDGLTVRTDLNAALKAIASTSKGASRPPGVQSGQLWIEDDNPSSSIWTLWWYDGAGDIPVLYVDTNSGKDFVIEPAKPMQAVTMSGSTLPLGTTYADLCSSSSTTTITALGTAPVGTIRTVYHSAAQTYQYNATSLLTPGAANYTTTAGDLLVWYSLGSGNWRCINKYSVASNVGTVTSVTASTGLTLTGSGTINPTLAVTNPIRAWANVTGSTGAMTASNGFTSCTRTGAGAYTFAFSSAMPDANYSVVAHPQSGNAGGLYAYITSKTTSGFTVSTRTTSFSDYSDSYPSDTNFAVQVVR